MTVHSQSSRITVDTEAEHPGVGGVLLGETVRG
jgi:hypothetical protein